ncbi:MAG: hypothetical protein HGA38_02600 [Candidatus Moranbacteria bacterium]|nr:hypothetical protein [Candidatus Moranbacteria bacterium]
MRIPKIFIERITRLESVERNDPRSYPECLFIEAYGRHEETHVFVLTDGNDRVSVITVPKGSFERLPNDFQTDCYGFDPIFEENSVHLILEDCDGTIQTLREPIDSFLVGSLREEYVPILPDIPHPIAACRLYGKKAFLVLMPPYEQDCYYFVKLNPKAIGIPEGDESAETDPEAFEVISENGDLIIRKRRQV